MKVESLRAHITGLLELATTGDQSLAAVSQVRQGTLSVMQMVYGPNSPMASHLVTSLSHHRSLEPGSSGTIIEVRAICRGTLKSVLAELDAGLAGSLQATVAGEVLTDLIALCKTVLDESGDGAKNVAAVLAAAAFEDTMRRMAFLHGIPHQETLIAVLSALKEKDILHGAQVGIAQSYLGFRNKALHAQWELIERPAITSALGFVEQLILEHFT